MSTSKSRPQVPEDFDPYAAPAKHPERDAPQGSVREAAQRLRHFVRSHAPGGCRILAMGGRCDCALCAIDDLEHAALSVPSGEKAPLREQLASLIGAACEARRDFQADGLDMDQYDEAAFVADYLLTNGPERGIALEAVASGEPSVPPPSEPEKHVRTAQRYVDAAFETLTAEDGKGVLRPKAEVVGDEVDFAAESLLHANEELAFVRAALAPGAPREQEGEE